MRWTDQLDVGTAETLLAGGVLIGIGWIIGRFGRLRRSPKPMCHCGHAFGAHDPATGHCIAEVDVNFTDTGWVQGPCPCRVYTGPEPVLSAWALERMHAQAEAEAEADRAAS